jgi:hypothetical protein
MAQQHRDGWIVRDINATTTNAISGRSLAAHQIALSSERDRAIYYAVLLLGIVSIESPKPLLPEELDKVYSEIMHLSELPSEEAE